MKLSAASLLAALLAAGCAATSPEGTPGPDSGETVSGPAGRHGGLSAAGEALLVQGANARRSGDYRTASATLERALRIEPSAPALWLELARVRLLEGNPAQAEQLARKAQSVAGGEERVAAQAEEILLEVRKRQGGSVLAEPPES